jgi:hypothetical protein
MPTFEPEPDDPLLDILGSYDDAIAGGYAPGSPGCTPEPQPRLERLKSCLGLLDAVWPRTPSLSSGLNPPEVQRPPMSEPPGLGEMPKADQDLQGASMGLTARQVHRFIAKRGRARKELKD